MHAAATRAQHPLPTPMRRTPPLAAAVAALVATALVAAMPGAAAAQGTLSGQGFGYPPGGLGTRALGQGGANAETDPGSAVNPAALALWGGAGFTFNYGPEFRTVDAAGRSDRTTVARFPLIAAATPVGEHLTVGVSAATLLDRTFSSAAFSQQVLSGGETITTTSTYTSEGAAEDVRGGIAWAPWRAVSIGVGLHAFTGENRTRLVGNFVDSAITNPNSPYNPYLSVGSSRTLNFSGIGVSGGVLLQPTRALTLAASGRKGGTIRLSTGDTLHSKADVPDRFGVGVRFDGIPGASLSARADWQGWTALRGLGSSAVGTTDAWEYAAGVDAAGPRLGTRVIQVRAGARLRTLPFLAGGAEVKETAFSGGLGIPLAAARAGLDVALQHASRSASGSGAAEHAWTLGLGLTVRP
jgi:hypothetical protein